MDVEFCLEDLTHQHREDAIFPVLWVCQNNAQNRLFALVPGGKKLRCAYMTCLAVALTSSLHF